MLQLPQKLRIRFRLITACSSVSVAADGTRVAAVDPGGPAALAGLTPGMTIVQLNGVTLKGMNESVVSQLLGATTGKGRFTLGDGRTIEIDKAKPDAPTATTPVANPS
jgi:predicted metalloprotease with PDZ domain